MPIIVEFWKMLELGWSEDIAPNGWWDLAIYLGTYIIKSGIRRFIGEPFCCYSTLSHIFSSWHTNSQSHNLNHCLFIVDWTQRNLFQWYFIRNLNVFLKIKLFESIVCKMPPVVVRPQSVQTDTTPFAWGYDAIRSIHTVYSLIGAQCTHPPT